MNWILKSIRERCVLPKGTWNLKGLNLNRLPLSLVAITLFSHAIQADMFQCVDSVSGKIMFTDKDCPDNKPGKEIEAKPDYATEYDAAISNIEKRMEVYKFPAYQKTISETTTSEDRCENVNYKYQILIAEASYIESQALSLSSEVDKLLLLKKSKFIRADAAALSKECPSD